MAFERGRSAASPATSLPAAWHPLAPVAACTQVSTTSSGRHMLASCVCWAWRRWTSTDAMLAALSAGLSLTA